MPTENVYHILEERGFIHQTTAPKELPKRLASEQMTVYCGFDPTATSLHLGSLVPLMALSHFQRCGHKVICVVGGATGMIGDPSGKSEERTLLDEATIQANIDGMAAQFGRFVDLGEDGWIENNFDWIGKFSYIEWLRDVGKHFKVNYMMAKDSVKKRLEDRDQGISYTEFSYMLLQGYDFYHLFKHHNCTIQVGGSDQWGNITAGAELVRRMGGGDVFGLTFPLLTTASGEKFGKSAGNAVWLDATMTSPWDMFQYWVRTEDADVERFLKLFTYLPLSAIEALMAEHQAQPGVRQAQGVLAMEATALVHGRELAESLAMGAKYLYGQDVSEIDEQGLLGVLADAPTFETTQETLSAGVPLVEALVGGGLAKSKGEARRLIKAGGISINKEKVSDEQKVLTAEDLLTEHTCLLRSGKKNYLLLRVKD